MEKDAEKAREIALKIWGKWDYDHEYGDKKDRELAKSQHEAKLSTTERLIASAIASAEKNAYEKGREEVIKSHQNSPAYNAGKEIGWNEAIAEAVKVVEDELKHTTSYEFILNKIIPRLKK